MNGVDDQAEEAYYYEYFPHGSISLVLLYLLYAKGAVPGFLSVCGLCRSGAGADGQGRIVQDSRAHKGGWDGAGCIVPDFGAYQGGWDGAG